MSARIIIESDGERYVSNEDVVAAYNEELHAMAIGDTTSDALAVIYVNKIPPVKRTDNSEVIARLEAENAELRKRNDILLREGRKGKLCGGLCKGAGLLIEQFAEEENKLKAENEKMREALKGVVNIANSRIPTATIDGEFEIMREAQAIINGISRKDEDISRKGGAK